MFKILLTSQVHAMLQGDILENLASTLSFKVFQTMENEPACFMMSEGTNTIYKQARN